VTDWELVLRGGRVIDPETGLDEVRDVAVADGRVAPRPGLVRASGARGRSRPDPPSNGHSNALSCTNKLFPLTSILCSNSRHGSAR